MRNIFLAVFSILLVLILLPTTIFAQGQGNRVQNQNQIQTQNQGEDQQLQVATQEQESLQEDGDEESENQVQGQPKKVSPRSETAREHMTGVAQKVEELLTTQGAKVGIGQEISAVAREQQQAQKQIKEELDNLEARPGWVKRLFGPNYRAIKNLRKQIEQNRLRIQRLTQLQSQITNQADRTQLQEAIQVLTKQNTVLEEQIQAEERISSLFGWLFKLLTK